MCGVSGAVVPTDCPDDSIVVLSPPAGPELQAADDQAGVREVKLPLDFTKLEAVRTGQEGLGWNIRG